MARQSRRLNLYTDEPSEDAYHMVRWMANQPIGNTKLDHRGKDVEVPAILDPREPGPGALLPKITVTNWDP